MSHWRTAAKGWRRPYARPRTAPRDRRSPESQMIMWKPTACQIERKMMAPRAVLGLFSRPVPAHAPKVIVLIMELINPFSWYMNFHRIDTTTIDVTTGMKKMTRRRSPRAGCDSRAPRAAARRPPGRVPRRVRTRRCSRWTAGRRVGERAGEVVESDESRRIRRDEPGVGEGEGERQDDGDDEEEHQKDRSRRDHAESGPGLSPPDGAESAKGSPRGLGGDRGRRDSHGITWDSGGSGDAERPHALATGIRTRRWTRCWCRCRSRRCRACSARRRRS